MSALYKAGIGCSCQHRDSIIVKHHYRYDIFNIVINFQFMKLNHIFLDNTM